MVIEAMVRLVIANRMHYFVGNKNSGTQTNRTLNATCLHPPLLWMRCNLHPLLANQSLAGTI